jgi:hypothetical protein
VLDLITREIIAINTTSKSVDSTYFHCYNCSCLSCSLFSNVYNIYVAYILLTSQLSLFYVHVHNIFLFSHFILSLDD